MTSAILMRNARKRSGLTQAALAARLGKSQSEIARWERGDVLPSFETLQRVVRACGLELTTRLSVGDDSYASHIERALRLSPVERVRRAASHATSNRRLRARLASGAGG